MLDSQSQAFRQTQLLRIEKRRRYRSWIHAFQIGMLLFFADQILKTYCLGQLEEGETRPILGQQIVSLAKMPDPGVVKRVQALFPASALDSLGVVFGGFLVVLLFLRLGSARWGELFSYSLFLTGVISNLVSHYVTYTVFDTLVIQVAGVRLAVFNIADLCLIVGTLLIVRGWFLRVCFRWLQVSRHSI